MRRSRLQSAQRSLELVDAALELLDPLVESLPLELLQPRIVLAPMYGPSAARAWSA